MFNPLIVTAGLLLRMLPWGGRVLQHTQRCESTWSCVFTSSSVSEAWQGPAPPQARQICWKGQVGAAKGTQNIQELSQPQGRPCTSICAWTCHSRGDVLTTQLLLSGISLAVPFGRGKTIKQADMNNLSACLADSCQDQQSRVIYLSTCVISFFFPPKKRSCKCQ